MPTIRCPYCSEKILSTAKKCKHCGEFLDKEQQSKEKADGIVNTLGSLGGTILKIWFGILVILGGLFALIYGLLLM